MDRFAVAQSCVVNLLAFVLVVADGIPLRRSVSGDDSFQLLLTASVQEPQEGRNHGEDQDAT